MLAARTIFKAEYVHKANSEIQKVKSITEQIYVHIRIIHTYVNRNTKGQIFNKQLIQFANQRCCNT